MNDLKAKIYLTIAAIVSIGWLGAWFAGLIVTPAPSWPWRYRLLGLGFVVAGGALCLWGRRIASQQEAAQGYLTELCDLEPHEFISGAADAELSRLPADNPWRDPFERLTLRRREDAERFEEADHARAALEVRLRRQTTRQAQIEAVLAMLPEPLLVVDAFEEVIFANASAQRLLGIELDSARPRPLEAAVGCQPLIELLSETRRRRSPNPRTGEIELLDDSGQPRCYGVTVRTLPAEADQATAGGTGEAGAFAVLRDLSTLKSSQKQYAEFVSAVSHEMKTPLAGIKAYLELLVDGDAEDEQTREEFLSVINSQANRLQRLIDNLLNLARIEAGVVHVSKEVNSLNELLDEALNIVRPAAEAKNIELAADLSRLYLGVLADRDMLMQAAINLLSNAIKYTPDGGRVVLRSRPVDDGALFEVEDTGVGLSEEDQLRVFDKFYRVKKDREMASGTGLGLSLAKHIVEDVHGGKLTVRSQLGKGSVFTVRLTTATPAAACRQ